MQNMFISLSKLTFLIGKDSQYSYFVNVLLSGFYIKSNKRIQDLKDATDLLDKVFIVLRIYIQNT